MICTDKHGTIVSRKRSNKKKEETIKRKKKFKNMRGLFSSMVVSEGVATLSLNNPAKRNSLGSQMIKSLAENLSSVRSDKSVRLVVIKADGHVFSSGHDLKELAGMDDFQARALFQMSAKMMKDMQELNVPVLAQVDGLAAAAGERPSWCVCAESSQAFNWLRRATWRFAQRQARFLLLGSDLACFAQLLQSLPFALRFLPNCCLTCCSPANPSTLLRLCE